MMPFLLQYRDLSGESVTLPYIPSEFKEEPL